MGGLLLGAVLMQQIAKNAGEGEQQQVLMVLSHLAASQPQLKSLPKFVAKVGVAHSTFPDRFESAFAIHDPA